MGGWSDTFWVARMVLPGPAWLNSSLFCSSPGSNHLHHHRGALRPKAKEANAGGLQPPSTSVHLRLPTHPKSDPRPCATRAGRPNAGGPRAACSSRFGPFRDRRSISHHAWPPPKVRRSLRGLSSWTTSGTSRARDKIYGRFWTGDVGIAW